MSKFEKTVLVLLAAILGITILSAFDWAKIKEYQYLAVGVAAILAAMITATAVTYASIRSARENAKNIEAQIQDASKKALQERRRKMFELDMREIQKMSQLAGVLSSEILAVRARTKAAIKRFEQGLKLIPDSDEKIVTPAGILPFNVYTEVFDANLARICELENETQRIVVKFYSSLKQRQILVERYRNLDGKRSPKKIRSLVESFVTTLNRQLNDADHVVEVLGDDIELARVIVDEYVEVLAANEDDLPDIHTFRNSAWERFAALNEKHVTKSEEDSTPEIDFDDFAPESDEK